MVSKENYRRREGVGGYHLESKVESCDARRAMWLDECSTSSAMMKALFVLVATREDAADTRAFRKRPSPWRTALDATCLQTLCSPAPERLGECLFHFNK